MARRRVSFLGSLFTPLRLRELTLFNRGAPPMWQLPNDCHGLRAAYRQRFGAEFALSPSHAILFSQDAWRLGVQRRCHHARRALSIGETEGKMRKILATAALAVIAASPAFAQTRLRTPTPNSNAPMIRIPPSSLPGTGVSEQNTSSPDATYPKQIKQDYDPMFNDPTQRNPNLRKR
jgi:hypothetical protein